MSDIYYPHDYIPGPTYDNYGFESTDPMIRTDRVGACKAAEKIYFRAD